MQKFKRTVSPERMKELLDGGKTDDLVEVLEFVTESIDVVTKMICKKKLRYAVIVLEEGQSEYDTALCASSISPDQLRSILQDMLNRAGGGGAIAIPALSKN